MLQLVSRLVLKELLRSEQALLLTAGGSVFVEIGSVQLVFNGLL